jgi:hypothetical protein
VDGAFGRNPYVAIEPPHQELTDLARAPVGLFALETDDEAFDLRGRLIGIAHRTPRAVRESLKPVLFVTVEDLMAAAEA